MNRNQYECALTGVTEDAGMASDVDGLDDLPVGWTKITMTRRQYNPRWLAIQQVKEATVEALLQQFPEEIRDVQRFVVQIQVEAQLKALENDTPMYLTDVEDVVYISESPEITSALNEIRQNLGLAELDESNDEEEEKE
jgi:hypothetical protein